MSELISIADAAKRLSISRSGIYRLLNTGHLKSKKVFQRNLVFTASIEEFLSDPSPVLKEPAIGLIAAQRIEVR
ncbi:MAG: helix-turn-helix domain-containing protein [Sphingorhabdus sp.]